jgi:hypothetical protein
MKDCRIGKFTVDVDLIEKYPEAVRDLMGRCIVVRAKMMFVSREIQYTALCDDFDVVSQMDLPPDYRAVFWKEGDRAFFRGWEKLF